jgi:TldD protein
MVKILIKPIIYDLASQALDLIHQAGCEYGDIRFCTYRNQTLSANDRSLTKVTDHQESGFGVRVLLNGAWGFAASHRQTPEELIRAVNLAVEIAKASRLCQQNPVRLVPVQAYQDTYITPIKLDPFSISISEKANLLLTINDRLLQYEKQGIRKASSSLQFNLENKLFASTEGSLIEQTIYRSYSG